MADENKHSPADASLNDEFYEEQFDGLADDSDRCVAAVAPAPMADFGLPLNPEEIQPRYSDEFEADTQEISRGITELDMGAPSPLTTTFDPSSEEFEPNHAPAFFASGGLFAPSAGAPSDTLTAPPLPFYLKPAPTSFRSGAPLPELISSLESSFAALSVVTAPLEDCACAYECSKMSLMSTVAFEVRVFATESARPEHLVEVKRTGGCRYAFADTASELLTKFGCPECAVPAKAAFKPPYLNDGALLDLPSLSRATSAPAALPNAPSRTAEEDHREPPVPLSFEVSAEEGESAACTCDQVLALLDSKGPVATQVQGARAAGALAASLTDAMDSCSQLGACGADHRGHHLLFAEGGAWLTLAERVTELSQATPPSGATDGEAAAWEELRSVAMAAVANVAALEHVCQIWLISAVATVVAGVKDEHDQPHVKREALRAAEALAKRDKALAAKLVRAGVVHTLEVEAEGGDEGPRDDAARRYAQGALEACRA